MHKRALAIASLLSSKHGIKKGSKVAIVSKNTPTWGAVRILGFPPAPSKVSIDVVGHSLVGRGSRRGQLLAHYRRYGPLSGTS